MSRFKNIKYFIKNQRKTQFFPKLISNTLFMLLEKKKTTLNIALDIIQTI